MDKQNDGLICDILMDKFIDFEKAIKANSKDDISLFSRDGSIQKFSIVYYGKHFNYQLNLLLKVEAGNCSVETWVEKVIGNDNYVEGICSKYPPFIHALINSAKTLEGFYTKKSLSLIDEDTDHGLFA